MPKKWIQAAIKHPGALTKKAKAAGQTPMEYARAKAGAGGATGKQARLALTLRKLAKRKKRQVVGRRLTYDELIGKSGD